MSKVWTIIEILEWTKQYFSKKGVENPRLDAEILLCFVLKKERIFLYVHFDEPLTKEELKIYKELILRRGNHEPLAYILGQKEFMNWQVMVNNNVLVPRPETELLVEEIIKWSEGKNCTQILELGVGSGAIIISLLKSNVLWQGTGLDISSEALTVTKENAIRQNVLDRLQLLSSDLFTAVDKNLHFDIIVSNPPYITSEDMKILAKDVLNEPHLALSGGEDGLDFYRRIAHQVTNFLAPQGLVALEVGYNQASIVAELLNEVGLKNIRSQKDYSNIERMVFGEKE